MMNKLSDPGSFRDPAGYVFWHEGQVFRAITEDYKEQYSYISSCGLLEALIDEGLLINHKEVSMVNAGPYSKVYKVIQPHKIPFISYPYEWSFGQLKDAALLTLKIFRKALQHDIVLKDASAYNIQFEGYKPVLIDTLSFDFYEEGSPWVAYRQFCQHFLAPLLLMAYVDLRSNQLQKIFLDGIPLDLTYKMLPLKAKLRFSVLAHVGLHAKMQEKYSDGQHARPTAKKLPKSGLMHLIKDLETTIKSLKISQKDTEWANYYNSTNYNETSFSEKKELVLTYLKKVKSTTIWDVGANDGTFSRQALQAASSVVSFDIDPIAVEKNYQAAKEKKELALLPLVMDFTNPTPALGWNWEERQALNKRAKPDLVMALALVHHLAISNNLPLCKIASYFASLTEFLIIEFVPKEDSQVKRLLSSRKDIFLNYHQSQFEKEFGLYYEIVQQDPVPGTVRTLYLLRKK